MGVKSVIVAAAAVVAVGLLAPRPALAISADGGIRTAGDWLELCADKADASAAACRAYIQGAVQAAELMRAVDRRGRVGSLFCAPDTLSTDDFVASIRDLVERHPERRDYPAATVVVGGGMELYPCKAVRRGSYRGRRRRR